MKYCCLFGGFLLLYIGMIAGCQKASQLDGLVPASGVVLYENAPIANASVVFSPSSSGTNRRSASATTDEKGHFSMMTLNPGDGIFPGEYIVAISKVEQLGEPVTKTLPNGEVRRSRTDERIREMLPAKYKDAKTSGLKITIPDKGDKKIEFKLEGKVDDTPKAPSGPGGGRRR